MTSDQYECVCHSCDDNEVFTEFGRAQADFNDHADRGCEVVLRNVSSSVTPATTESAHSETTAEESQPAED